MAASPHSRWVPKGVDGREGSSSKGQVGPGCQFSQGPPKRPQVWLEVIVGPQSGLRAAPMLLKRDREV